MASKDASVVGNWIVRLRVTRCFEAKCQDCTREEAEKSPFTLSGIELDADAVTWEVESVKESSDE